MDGYGGKNHEGDDGLDGLDDPVDLLFVPVEVGVVFGFVDGFEGEGGDEDGTCGRGFSLVFDSKRG